MTSNKEKRKDLPLNEKNQSSIFGKAWNDAKRCSQKMESVCCSGLWIKVLSKIGRVISEVS